jgi:hypothetical protein
MLCIFGDKSIDIGVVTVLVLVQLLVFASDLFLAHVESSVGTADIGSDITELTKRKIERNILAKMYMPFDFMLSDALASSGLNTQYLTPI